MRVLTSLLKRLIVIVSHPRSGTHLTVDLIRRNFPAFQVKLPIYASSKYLAVNADLPDWQGTLEGLRAYHPSGDAIIASHHGGVFDPDIIRNIERLGASQVIYIYPFRQFSRTTRSLWNFTYQAPKFSTFLDSFDSFFGEDRSVGSCLEHHARQWLRRDPYFLNVDAMISDPDSAVRDLEKLLGENSAKLKRILPRPKVSHTVFGEAFELIRGRESTAVVVPERKAQPTKAELQSVDDRFARLYQELSARTMLAPPLDYSGGAACS